MSWKPSAERFRERGHPVWIEVDLAALRHNVEVLKALAHPAEVMGVVKGYAYGHGNPQVARALIQGGATRLGVARLAEAIHLRRSGIDAPILLFTEPPTAAIPALLEHEVTPAVYTQAFAGALSNEATARKRRVGVHVKLDTGMHRVGLLSDDVMDAIRALRSMGNLEIEGLWSHLAVADRPEHPFTRTQLDLFSRLVDEIESAGVTATCKHLANSAAAMWLKESHFDLVRCGIACYGLWPGPALVGCADLKPALSLRARVGLVKELPGGAALSYGLTYRLPADARVATVPVGYADGYARSLSGRADVLIGGERYRVSGTVCMDQFMVDVGRADVSAGDVVTLIGSDGDESVSAEELAALLGTINYEITTGLPSRVPRIYLNERKP